MLLVVDLENEIKCGRLYVWRCVCVRVCVRGGKSECQTLNDPSREGLTYVCAQQ